MNEQALKDKLRLIANLRKIDFQEVWKSLILERFLVRLANSNYHHKLIFKGGFLLAYYIPIARETMDIDLLARKLKAEMKNIQDAFYQICAVKIDDGFSISFSNIEQLNHPHMNYDGYQVRLNVQFGKMKDRIHVDIGVGDAVEPQEKSFRLYQYKEKPLFEDSVSLQVYPIETIFSEKLESIVSRKGANSRMKDFHDILLLCREKNKINTENLKISIDNTFQNRKTEKIIPIKFSKEEYLQLQPRWKQHLQLLGSTAKTLNFPEKIADLVDEANLWLGSLLAHT